MTLRIHHLLFVFLFFAACAPSRQWIQLRTSADEAFSRKDYEYAFSAYEIIIEHLRSEKIAIEGELYQKAGISAWHRGVTPKVLEYLENVRFTPAANAQTYVALAQVYREIDNLSREISALETYVNDFPEGEEIISMRTRLFETYIESKSWQQAFDIWPSIDEEAKKKEGYINNYFLVNKTLGNETILDDLAVQLLALNDKNMDALDHMAKMYFWKAENRYQQEMKAYEQNRTHRQYATLLKGFEVLNADFRKSLELFLKVYELNPRPEQARYIGNIYLRFDDKRKASFYHSKADEKN